MVIAYRVEDTTEYPSPPNRGGGAISKVYAVGGTNLVYVHSGGDFLTLALMENLIHRKNHTSFRGYCLFLVKN